MAVAEFLEDIALHLLQHLGFHYLTPTEALALRGGKRSQVVLDTILLEWVIPFFWRFLRYF